MRFDLLIRGGEVIDPGGANEGRLDVAVTRGRIAAVDGSIPRESASRVIDADGMFVTPGLVDLHTHVYRGATYWGLDPDPIASRSGVTTWADAGSAGALTLPGFREFIVERSVSRIKAFLNISMIGLVGENHESANLSYLDTDLFRRLVDEHRDLVVGVKVRMGTPNVGENGIEPLRRARRAADECGLPLMVHVSVAPPSIEEVLALMRPGDILTHCCTGLSMRIVDENGQLFDFAKRAWDDGVVIDTAHGSGSFSWATAEALLAAGRLPDTISTDLHQLSIRFPAYDLPTCLTKFLHLGVPLREVIRAATYRPAEVLGLEREIGSLRPGMTADMALFELLEGRFPLYDAPGEVREARQLLRNTLTIVAGRPMRPMPASPPAPWIEEPTWPADQSPFSRRQRELRELGHTPDAMAASVGSAGPSSPPSYQQY
jgi:dihydroorotase